MADISTAPAAATIEINDLMLCSHFKEVCADCNFDGREENDAFFGFDPIDREGIEAPPAIVNKDGVYQCKKHALAGAFFSFFLPRPPTSLPPSSSSPLPYSLFLPYPGLMLINLLRVACNQCYGWKKQINRARTAAKKAGKK
ncbi:hypothetical protein DFH06DRAFT_1169598 [Mycena polygramma]|nr:hypothetical protein DFH06DRAFT_1169598 [Mycena polygramma]